MLERLNLSLTLQVIKGGGGGLRAKTTYPGIESFILSPCKFKV
jgi:hypothetical protein